MELTPIRFNPEIDLKLERILDVPAHLLFQAWTTPTHMKHFFCPKPYGTENIEIDLRPGGEISMDIVGPDGQRFPNKGCYLEIVENRRLVWTDAMTGGFRPAEKPFMTGFVDFEDLVDGTTRYTAVALHPNAETKAQHEAMGFHEGWGIVADQLVEYIKTSMM